MNATIELTPELMAGFLDEAREHLAALNTHLMAFEKSAESGPILFDQDDDRQRMTEMFRAAHSLKGLSATFGFGEINQLTHRMETLFDEARNGRRAFDAETLSRLLGCVGVLEELVVQLESPDGPAPDAEKAMHDMEQLMAQAPTAATPTPPGPSAAAPAANAGAAAPTPAGAAPAMPESLLGDAELRKLFIESTREAVEELNGKLLQLEQAADDVLLNEAFRVAHNLKGACGAAGLSDVTRLTHEMESRFDQLRNKQLSLSDGLMSAFFAVADRIGEVVEQVKSDRYAAWSDDEISAIFAPGAAPTPSATTAPTSSGTTANPSEPAAAQSESESAGDAPEQLLPGCAAPADLVRQAGHGYFVRVTFAPEPTDVDFQDLLILNRLKMVGDVLWTSVDLSGGDRGSAAEVDFLVAASDAADLQIETIVAQLRAFKPKDVFIQVFDALYLGDSTNTATPPAVISTAAATPDAPKAPAADATTAVARETAKAPAQSPVAPVAANAARAPATSGGPAASGAPTDAARKPATPTSTATIRVDVERLDQLMNLGGELVINRARFTQMARDLRTLFEGKDVTYVADDVAAQLAQTTVEARALAEGHPAFAGLVDRLASMSAEFAVVHGIVRRVHESRTVMHSFDEAVNTLGRISEGLQKRIMDTRMVPVGPLFQRFNRMVRDIAKELGKKIDFETIGEQTEMDKKMIDDLADPLTHMVRNSADHGIERPEDRVAAGKSATARIVLAAYHQGNNICIEVRDDGKGIDLQRVREKLLERELASEAQIAQMSDRELVQYVFHPGFSTAQQVSDLSGRGMGMDIVKTKIANLNGTVEIDTRPGQGTTVTIRLPLTMAIINALQTRIGGEVYCLPLETVAEIVTLQRSVIRSVQGQQVARIRDSVIPIYMIEDLMQVPQPELRTACRDAAEWTIVIISAGGQRMGLVVDFLIGQEDVVIKSLAENFRNVVGVSGATIMGDGRVSLILDVSQLMNGRAARGADGGARPAPRGARTESSTSGAGATA